jgi:2-succinyl-6-hydroxy-2,4-cyclohexadiene-1-carboxylate synthase
VSVSAPIHVWRRGPGVPLLLVLGFAGHAEGWAEVAGLLPEGRTILGLTLPGHDPASSAPPGASFTECVDQIASWLKASASAPFEAAGYSMGGRVVLGLLARHPGLVSSALLVGANPGLGTDEERRERAEWEEGWARLLEEEGIEAFAAIWESLPLFETQTCLPPERLERQRAIRLRHDARGLAAALRSLGLAAMPDYRPALPGITVPVRLLVGERDEKFLAIARDMERDLPRGALIVAPGAGHNVILERPELVAGLLARQ